MAHIVVDAIVRYPAMIRDRGQIKQRQAVREEQVPVRVAVLSEADAPLVAKIATMDMLWIRDGSEAVPPTIPLRSHMGDLFAPIGSRFASNDYQTLHPRLFDDEEAQPLPWLVPKRTGSELSEALIADKGPLNTGARVYETTRLVREADLGNLRDIEPRGREEALEKLNARASQIVLMDGLIWERVAEPCWLIKHDSDGQLGAELRWSDDQNVERAPMLAFRLDRLIDAQATMAGWGGPDGEGVRGEAECLRPEVLRFDPVPEALLQAAIYAVRSWSMSDFMKASVHEAAAWIGLRDAVTAIDPLAANPDHRTEEPRPIAARADEMNPILEALEAYQQARGQALAERRPPGAEVAVSHELSLIARASHRWQLEHDGPGDVSDHSLPGR